MRKRIAWLITTGLVASALAVPGIALAHTNEAIAETGGMELALLGAELTVDIGLDEFGNIVMIDVMDPAAPETEGEEAADGAIEVTDPHRMRFELGDDGTRMAVMAKKHKLTSKVQAGSFDALLGQHEWSSELFPGSEVDVLFTVSGTADAPIVTVDGVVGLPPEATSDIGPGDGDDGEAIAVVTFSLDGYTKVLKIKVAVDDEDGDDEDGPSAVLKIELRAKDRQRLQGELAELAGPRTWTGRLCEGEVVAVDYVINPDGTLTEPTVTAPVDQLYTIKLQERGFQVRFDGTKARLQVKFGQTEEGVWDLKVDAKTTEKCKHDDGDRSKKDRPERAKEKGNDGDESAGD